MSRTRARLGVLTLGALFVVSACAPAAGPAPAPAPAVTIPTGERTFAMTGIEYKGSTSTKDLGVPDRDPSKLSDGYRYKPPGKADASDATKWEVSSYRFEPGSLTAITGDKVTLLVFIVNGDKHNVWIEGPDGKELLGKQTMNRGREYKLTLTLAKPGAYRIVCEEHDPTMTAYLWALPR